MQIRFWKPKSMANMRPQISAVLSVVASFDGEATCWVTSITRPTDEESLHQHGQAIDFDLVGGESNGWLKAKLRRALPDDLYDVIHEDPGEENDHVHVEYDP